MKFEIIPSEQTPKIPDVDINIKEYIEKHREELNAFLEFAKEQPTAVGLAANQTSLDGDRFMIRAFALKNTNEGTWALVINPIITENVGIKETLVEYCLTWKGMKLFVERYRGIKVSFYDMDGNFYKDIFVSGYDGQIYQHEINHLNGVEEDVVSLKTLEPRPVDAIRNDPCPCGSGKKYKKCCLNKTN